MTTTNEPEALPAPPAPVPPVPQVHAAICKAMRMMEPIAKGRKNQQQGYQFRGIDDVYAGVQLVLADCGLHVVPRVLSCERREWSTKNGGTMFCAYLTISHTFYCATDGSSVELVIVGEGMDTGDKASNKAMSVAMKYALIEALCIPTADAKDPEDDDPKVTGRKAPPRSLAEAAASTAPQEAAGRAQPKADPKPAPPAATQAAKPQPATRPQVPDDPQPPVQPKPDGVGNVSLYEVLVPLKVWEGFPGKWGGYAIESKMKSVDGKLWKDMPKGSVGGGSESWLKAMVAAAVKKFVDGQLAAVTQNEQRAAVALWHMHKLRFDAWRDDAAEAKFDAVLESTPAPTSGEQLFQDGEGPHTYDPADLHD